MNAQQTYDKDNKNKHLRGSVESRAPHLTQAMHLTRCCVEYGSRVQLDVLSDDADARCT